MMVKKSETYRTNKNCRNGPLGKKIGLVYIKPSDD